MTEEDRDDNAQPGAGELPGAQLARAREDAGWDVGQVAASLHLGQAVIEALERDDYEALPPPLFVRGYIRAYAELVGVDPAPLLAAFRAHAADQDESPGGGPAVRDTAAMPVRRLGLAATALVVILAAALGGAWWLAGPSGQAGRDAERAAASPASDPTADSAAGSAADSAADSAAEAAEDSAADSTSDSAAGSATGDSREGTASDAPPRPRGSDATEGSSGELAESGSQEPDAVGPDPGAPASSSPTGESVDQGSEAASEIERDDGEGAAGDAAESQGEATGAASAQEPPPIPSGEEVELFFRFEGNSWVEVRDARGVALVRRLLRPGMTRRVVGQRPVNVHLGNAPAVVLRVDGERYPVERHTRSNDVARFVVPAPDSEATGESSAESDGQ